MPKMIPVQGVVVQRDGKSVMAPLDEPFEFTQAELDDIQRLNPAAIRAPINELPAAPAPAPVSGKASKAAPQGEL